MKKSYYLLVPVIALVAVLSFAALSLTTNHAVAADTEKSEVAPCSMKPDCAKAGKPCGQRMESAPCDMHGKGGDCCKKRMMHHGEQCNKEACCGKCAKCANCEKRANCDKKANCEKCMKGEGKRHCDKPCKSGPCAAKAGADDEPLEELFKEDKS